jgi:hypothetical protein
MNVNFWRNELAKGKAIYCLLKGSNKHRVVFIGNRYIRTFAGSKLLSDVIQFGHGDEF